MYIFQHPHCNTVLVIMHSLTPLLSLEFALIWGGGGKDIEVTVQNYYLF